MIDDLGDRQTFTCNGCTMRGSCCADVVRPSAGTRSATRTTYRATFSQARVLQNRAIIVFVYIFILLSCLYLFILRSFCGLRIALLMFLSSVFCNCRCCPSPFSGCCPTEKLAFTRYIVTTRELNKFPIGSTHSLTSFGSRNL